MTYNELLAKFENWGVEHPYVQPWKNALFEVVKLPEEPWDKAKEDFPDHYVEFHSGWKEAMKLVFETIEKELA